jgi:hypothetical protein
VTSISEDFPVEVGLLEASSSRSCCSGRSLRQFKFSTNYLEQTLQSFKVLPCDNGL